MSKYIKLEDAIRNINLEVTGRKEYTGDMKANLFFALDDLPTIEVSEDCISREWVLEKIDECYGETVYACNLVVALERAVKSAPSVVHSRAEGEWIYIDEPIMGNPYGRYRCSECEMDKPHKTDYCPNCGAKMKGADDE